MKRAAHAHDSPELTAARGVWCRLPGRQQRRIVEEIVRTRAEELSLAYPDIRSLGFGYRREAGRSVPEWAVVFTVERKLKRLPPGHRAIPDHLLTYARPPRRKARVMCAVPTDIEDRHRGRAIPHHGVLMRSPGGAVATGSITCAVRVPGDPDTHALTCFHVAAMPDRRGQATAGASALTRGVPPALLGSFWPTWRGRLVSGPTLSLDSAVLRVPASALGVLRALLPPPQPRFVQVPTGQVQNTCMIAIPNRAPALARHTRVWTLCREIDYLDDAVPEAVHTNIVEIEIMSNSPTQPAAGDSGSPVLSRDGATLLGLYIAGFMDSPRRFYLPAWFAFNGFNYGQSGQLTLISKP